MFRPRRLPIVVLLGLLPASLLGGCATFTAPVAGILPDWLPGEADRGPRYASTEMPVTQVAGFWRAAEDTGPNGRPVRGFAGKILLFPAKSRGDEPIAGRGTVRVSLFDQNGDADVLVHQYDLPPEAWATHLSRSNLGVGYEVFLPYMNSDPRRVRCGLRVRFVPEYEDGNPGRPVFSAVESCTLDAAGPLQAANRGAGGVARRPAGPPDRDYPPRPGRAPRPRTPPRTSPRTPSRCGRRSRLRRTTGRPGAAAGHVARGGRARPGDAGANRSGPRQAATPDHALGAGPDRQRAGRRVPQPPLHPHPGRSGRIGAGEPGRTDGAPAPVAMNRPPADRITTRPSNGG